MGKYYVEFSCGHGEEVCLFGPHVQRRNRIDYLEREGLCAACTEAEMQKRNAASVERNRDAGLPPLIGSPKQIGWGESIRAEKISQMARLKGHPEFMDAMDACMDRIKRITSAAWWIDNRSKQFDSHSIARRVVGVEQDTERAIALLNEAYQEGSHDQSN